MYQLIFITDFVLLFVLVGAHGFPRAFALRGNRNDLRARCFANLLVFEPGNVCCHGIAPGPQNQKLNHPQGVAEFLVVLSVQFANRIVGNWAGDKKKSITYLNVFIHISSANLSTFVAH